MDDIKQTYPITFRILDSLIEEKGDEDFTDEIEEYLDSQDEGLCTSIEAWLSGLTENEIQAIIEHNYENSPSCFRDAPNYTLEFFEAFIEEIN